MPAESVGQIGLDLVVNQKQFNKQMAGISSLAKKVGATLAAAFAVKKVVNFGKACLDLGSDLNEVQNVVDVTFPNMTQKLNDFAKNAIMTSGLSETMAKRFTGTFGAMAKSFGFTEQQAYDMSTSLTTLAGDIASFYNISQDAAYTKLKSVFTGETESLKELGVVMTQTALDSYAMANGFGKTTQQMSEAEKVALRYAFVTSKLSTAQGDFARTSGSWANQVRILKLQVDGLKATIGQGLINLFTPIIRVVNTLLGKLATLANAFKSFTELITGNKSSGSSQISSMGDAAVAAGAGMDGAAESADNMAASNDKIGKSAKKAAKEMRSLMGFDKINKLDTNPMENMDTGSSGGGSSSGSGASNLGSSVDFGNLAKGETVIDKVDSKFQKMFKNIKTMCEPAIKSLKRLWNEGLARLGNFSATALKDFYSEFLKPVGKWVLGKGIPEFVNILNKGLMKINFPKLNESLKKFWKAMEPFAEGFGEGLLEVFDFLVNSITVPAINLLAKGFELIADALSSVDPAIMKELGESFGKIAGAFLIIKGANGVFSVLKNTIGLLKGGSVAAGTGGAAAAKGGGLVGLIKTIASTTGGKFAGGISAIVAAGVKLQEFSDAVKGGNGELSELGGLMDSIAAQYSPKMSNEIFKLKEEMEDTGASTETIGQKFGDLFSNAGVTVEQLKTQFGNVAGSMNITTEQAEIFNAVLGMMRLNAEETGGKVEEQAEKSEKAYGLLKEALVDLQKNGVIPSQEHMDALTGALDKAHSSGYNAKGMLAAVKEEMGYLSLDTNKLQETLNKSDFSKAYDDMAASAENASVKVEKVNDGLVEKSGPSEKLKILRAKKDYVIFGKTADETAGKVSSLSEEISSTAKSFDDAYVDFKESAESLGKSVPEGLVLGFESGKPDVEEEGYKLTDRLNNIFKTEWGIHSPSTVAFGFSENYMKGLINGFQSMWSNLHEFVLNITTQLVSSFDLGNSLYEKGQAAMQGFANGIRSIHIPIPHLYTSSWDTHYTNAARTAWYRTPNFNVEWLAKGGFVEKNTPQLAMIGDNRHQGEVVAPEDKLRQMAMEAVQLAMKVNGAGPDAVTKTYLHQEIMRVIAAFSDMGFYVDGEQMAKANRSAQEVMDLRYNTVSFT